jgi:DNA-binding SARP family transcriptional activator
MELRILGPLEVLASGEHVALGGPRPRILLAVLALEANCVVPVERLVDAVWDESPPPTARSQLQMCVSGLRRTLAVTKLADAIVTRPPGYLLRVPPGELDAEVFDGMVASARIAAEAGRMAEAADGLHDALGLWRGPVLAGVSGRVVQAGTTRLEERRLHTLEERIRLDLQLGRHDDLVGELRSLVADYPLHERLRADLMLALYRSGRPVEALDAYRKARQTLIQELGIEPGEELHRLERAILSRRPELDLVAPVRAGGGPNADPTVVPRQLPHDIADFTGRDRLISLIHGMVTGSGPEREALPVVGVAGPGGVGKSTLAVHAAHLLSADFPDGQLYAKLQHGDRPVGPAEVLGRFLLALGVAGTAVPDGLDERAEMYRSRVADKRILVVLDDGADESQVVPLLPGTAACAVIITSRVRLTGLAGAYHIGVGVLDTAAGVTLLGRIAGSDRVRAEPESAAALAALGGGLPLALRIVGARLASRPHWKLSRMVERLRDETGRLDELEHANLGVRASISLSYVGLPGAAQQLLRRLAVLDAPDFAGWVAAALLDISLERAEDVLERLADAQLLLAGLDGATGVVRYRFHDLIRVFARERLAAEEPPAEVRAAGVRALEAWLALAEGAHRGEYGGDNSILHGGAARWPVPVDLAARLLEKPLAWLESERAGLVAAVRQAGSWDLDELCWDLALTSMTLFEAKNYFTEWWDTTEVALAATRRAGNHRGEAATLYSRGSLHCARQQLDQARTVFHLALRSFEDCADEHGQALVVNDLGFIDRLQGRSRSAMRHFARALAGLRAAGDRVAEANTLHNMAGTLLDTGDHEAGEKLLDDALAISQAAGGRRVEAQVWHRLGEIYLHKGELDRSAHAFGRVLRIVRDRGDRVGETYGLHGLGKVRHREGRHDRAEVSLDQALRLARQVGDRLSEARILLSLGELHLDQQRHALAEERLLAARAVFGQFGSVVWQAKALLALSAVHTARGEPQAAARATVGATGLLAAVESAEAQRLLERLTRDLPAAVDHGVRRARIA